MNEVVSQRLSDQRNSSLGALAFFFFENWYLSLPSLSSGLGLAGQGMVTVLRGWKDWGTARRVSWVCSKALRCLGTK